MVRKLGATRPGRSVRFQVRSSYAVFCHANPSCQVRHRSARHPGHHQRSLERVQGSRLRFIRSALGQLFFGSASPSDARADGSCLGQDPFRPGPASHRCRYCTTRRCWMVPPSKIRSDRQCTLYVRKITHDMWRKIDIDLL